MAEPTPTRRRLLAETPASTLPPPPKIVLQATQSDLLEPHLLVWFRQGKPVEVIRVTKWMNAQINAKLLQRM